MKLDYYVECRLIINPAFFSIYLSGLFKLRESQEARDKEALARLEELEEEFVTKADFEEALKDIITPGSRENR